MLITVLPSLRSDGKGGGKKKKKITATTFFLEDLTTCCIFSFVRGSGCRSRYFRKGLTFPSYIVSFWMCPDSQKYPHIREGKDQQALFGGCYFISLFIFVESIFQLAPVRRKAGEGARAVGTRLENLPVQVNAGRGGARLHGQKPVLGTLF